jgi:hypothetical protein
VVVKATFIAETVNCTTKTDDLTKTLRFDIQTADFWVESQSFVI